MAHDATCATELGRHGVGDKVRELGQIRFAEQYRAGFPQARHQGGFVRRNEARQRFASRRRGAAIGGEHIILDQEWHPMQGTAPAACRQIGIGETRLLEGERRQTAHAVEALRACIELPDALQIPGCHVGGRYRACSDCLADGPSRANGKQRRKIHHASVAIGQNRPERNFHKLCRKCQAGDADDIACALGLLAAIHRFSYLGAGVEGGIDVEHI